MKMYSSKINEENILEIFQKNYELAASLLDFNPYNYASYMTWSQFLSIFPKIYDLVHFDGNNWYWNEGIEIKLFYNGYVPEDYILFLDLERTKL